MPSSKVNVSLDISASPAAVFKFLIDLDRHILWNSGLLELSASGPLKPGMTYTMTTFLMGRKFEGKNHVTTFVPDRALEIQNSSGPLTYSIYYGLRPEKEGTRLTCQCDISGELSFFNLAAPLLEYLAQSRLEGDLNMFKGLVEHEPLV